MRDGSSEITHHGRNLKDPEGLQYSMNNNNYLSDNSTGKPERDFLSLLDELQARGCKQ
jgi:hypothetical protein